MSSSRWVKGQGTVLCLRPAVLFSFRQDREPSPVFGRDNTGFGVGDCGKIAAVIVSVGNRLIVLVGFLWDRGRHIPPVPLGQLYVSTQNRPLC